MNGFEALQTGFPSYPLFRPCCSINLTFFQYKSFPACPCPLGISSRAAPYFQESYRRDSVEIYLDISLLICVSSLKEDPKKDKMHRIDNKPSKPTASLYGCFSVISSGSQFEVRVSVWVAPILPAFNLVWVSSYVVPGERVGYEKTLSFLPPSLVYVVYAGYVGLL